MGKSLFSVESPIQSLAIEIYKVKEELSPIVTANVFCAMLENHYNHYNLRNYFRVTFPRTL